MKSTFESLQRGSYRSRRSWSLQIITGAVSGLATVALLSLAPVDAQESEPATQPAPGAHSQDASPPEQESDSDLIARLLKELSESEAASGAAPAAPETLAAPLKLRPILSPAEQQQRVKAIYELTKTVKTATEYGKFIEQCDSALSAGLSQKNLEYVTSLRGWALNRRGEKRFELAQQLAKIGNSQAKSAMAEAMSDFDAALIADSNRYRSWMSRGIAHVENQNWDQAIRDFTTVAKLKTDYANAWFNRAEALFHRGNFDYAERDYDLVLRLNSEDIEALTGRGHARLAQEKFDEAIADFSAVVERASENKDALLNRGDAYLAAGKIALAQADFDRSLKLGESVAGLQRMAWLMATSAEPQFRDPAKSVELARRAIEAGQESVMLLDTLAAAEAANGNFEQAKATQAKVIQLASSTMPITPADQTTDANVTTAATLPVDEGNGDENTGQTPSDIPNPYQVRLTLYEQGKPYVEK